MKQLVILSVVILVACGIAYVWMQHEWSKDQGHLVGMAVGNPQDGELELHVVVSMAMVRADVVPTAGRAGAQQWGQWIREHFELRDSAGKDVTFAREGHSNLISDQKAFNPEFFLRARLRARETYTFDYIPVKSEGRHYRHTFTVPAEGLSFHRAQFDPVRPG